MYLIFIIIIIFLILRCLHYMSYSKHLPDSSWRVLNLSVRSTAVMRRATHIIHDCKSEERDSAMLNPHVTTVEAEQDSYYFVYGYRTIWNI